jgi:hypothetical protein
MPLEKQFQHLTAFTAPGLGLIEWIVIPIGLLGCPARFQRLVELAMGGLINVIIYMDDLVLHSKNHAEQQEQLEFFSADYEIQVLKQTSANVNLDQTMKAT